MNENLRSQLSEHIAVYTRVLNDTDFLKKIDSAALVMTKALKDGHKILFCGNGGSASDALHAAAELSGRYLVDRKPLPAEALGCNFSSITAIGNDYGYEHVFSRDVIAKGQRGDVLVGISTSGNSQNVVAAMQAAKEKGVINVALCGAKKDTKMEKFADHYLAVPSIETPRIQECHIFILHYLCGEIEKAFV